MLILFTAKKQDGVFVVSMTSNVVQMFWPYMLQRWLQLSSAYVGSLVPTKWSPTHMNSYVPHLPLNLLLPYRQVLSRAEDTEKPEPLWWLLKWLVQKVERGIKCWFETQQGLNSGVVFCPELHSAFTLFYTDSVLLSLVAFLTSSSPWSTPFCSAPHSYLSCALFVPLSVQVVLVISWHADTISDTCSLLPVLLLLILSIYLFLLSTLCLLSSSSFLSFRQVWREQIRPAKLSHTESSIRAGGRL